MDQIRNVMKIIYWTLWYQSNVICFWRKFCISKIPMNQEITVCNLVPPFKTTETIRWWAKLFWYNAFDFSNMFISIFNIPNKGKNLKKFLPLCLIDRYQAPVNLKSFLTWIRPRIGKNAKCLTLSPLIHLLNFYGHALLLSKFIISQLFSSFSSFTLHSQNPPHLLLVSLIKWLTLIDSSASSLVDSKREIEREKKNRKWRNSIRKKIWTEVHQFYG